MIISDYWPGFPLKGPLLCEKPSRKARPLGVVVSAASRQQRVAKGIRISTWEVGWKKTSSETDFHHGINVTESDETNLTFVECLLRVVGFFKGNLERFSK